MDRGRTIARRWRRTVAHSGRQRADDLLAATVAAGQSLRDAAKLVGIGERTAARRWAEPAFQRKVVALRAAMVERALGRLSDAMSAAAEQLRELLGARSEAVRLGAARSLLELGVKLRESVELEQRVSALEARRGEGHEITSTYCET
jgi:HEAT repeat protein